MSADAREVLCPNCEAPGRVGEPCSEALCARKGYHAVPAEWFRSTRDWCRQKRRGMDPLVGRCVERYLLAGLLGQGGMGAVYLALQRPLMREVACKLISGVELTEQAVARFEREARAVAALDHPNIVRLYDYGVGDLGNPDDAGGGHEFRVPYMALEYVRHGHTLRHAFGTIARDAGSVPGDLVLHVFRQVLNALAAAHRVGIVHRDMKPDNVMVTSVEGNPHLVKLLDFGLAKAVAQVTGFDREVSRTGQFLGTPHYVAPEQVSPRDAHKVDGRADLYAIAVMLYEVFTGEMPHDGETPLEVLARKVDPAHDPFATAAAQRLPARVAAVLKRGLSADPAARHADAGELLAALEAAIPGTRTLAAAPVTLSYTPASDRPLTPASRVEAPASRAESPAPGPRIEPETIAAGPNAWSGKAPPGTAAEPVPITGELPAADARRIAGGSSRAIGWVLGGVLAAALTALGTWAWMSSGGRGSGPVEPPPLPAAAPAPDVAPVRDSAPAAPPEVVSDPGTPDVAKPPPGPGPDPDPNPDPDPKPKPKPDPDPKPRPQPRPQPRPKPQPTPEPEGPTEML